VFEHLQHIFSLNSGYILFRLNLQVLLFMYIHQKEAAHWFEEQLWYPGKRLSKFGCICWVKVWNSN